jgi:hypothetical protein
VSDDRDDLAPPGATPIGSLPVTWSNGQQQIQGKRALVVAPDASETARFASPRAATCADCVSFDLEAGQRAMAKERFLERLVIENNWKTKYLGSPPQTMGFCRQGDHTLTSAFAAACQHYRPHNGRIR